MSIVNKFVYLYLCHIMNTKLINALKGIHPGKIIERDLKKKDISQRNLAEKIGEHYQTLNAVIKGRRNLTVEMSVKIDAFLGYEEGFLYMLQGYYEIEQYHLKTASESVSGVPRIRRVLFWDTDFDRINWGRNRDFVISRILERGSKEEQAEIARFYGLPISDLEKIRNRNRYDIHKKS